MNTTRHWLTGCGLAVLSTTLLLGGCGKSETANVPTATTPQATVPPPPGDSTPKPADSSTRQAQESNEGKTDKASQSTVGTAASGAPPYSLNSAPEGNVAPSQGQKASEPEKK